MIANPQPLLDDCAAATATYAFSGQNIGDLMNTAGVTLGLVRGRLQADVDRSGANAVCAGTHTNAAGGVVGGLPPAPRAVPVLRLARRTRTISRRARWP